MTDNDPNRMQQYPPGQPYGTQPAAPNTLASGVQVGARAIPREGFLTGAFVWMFVGLLLSAGAALFVMNNNEALNRLVALGMFFVYALLNGLTIGVIVFSYTFDPAGGTSGISGVASAFLGAS